MLGDRDAVLTVLFAFLGRLCLLGEPRVQPRCCLGVVAVERDDRAGVRGSAIDGKREETWQKGRRRLVDS